MTLYDKSHKQVLTDVVNALDSIMTAYSNPDLLDIDDDIGDDLMSLYDRLTGIYALIDPDGYLDYTLA